GLGLRRARFASLPRPLVEAAARIGTRTGALLDVDSWRMLERGNTASVEHTRALLGRLPRLPAEFIAAHERPQALTLARLGWALPLLRASVAALWIFTGIVSLGIYPVEESYRLLARTGVPPAWAPIAL